MMLKTSTLLAIFVAASNAITVELYNPTTGVGCTGPAQTVKLDSFSCSAKVNEYRYWKIVEGGDSGFVAAYTGEGCTIQSSCQNAARIGSCVSAFVPRGGSFSIGWGASCSG